MWRALTRPEELKAWFPSDIVTDEWEVGAALTFRYWSDEHPPFTGTLLELEEPRLPRFDRYVSAFEPALGPQEGPPPGFEGETG